LLLDDKTLEIVALTAAGTAALSLLVTLALMVRLRKMRRAYTVLQGGRRGEDFVTLVGRQGTSVDELRAEVERLRERVKAMNREIADSLRHVAVVRYDAFPDMGGRLSFSAALLDDDGDGLVLSSINGRSETRTYAKGVKSWRSEHQLSPEETQAIGFATKAPKATAR